MRAKYSAHVTVTQLFLNWTYIIGENELFVGQCNPAVCGALEAWLQTQSSPVTSCHFKELTSNLQQSDRQLHAASELWEVLPSS